MALLSQLDPTPDGKHEAREALLGLLGRQTDGAVAEKLAAGLVQLDPAAEEKRLALSALLSIVAVTCGSYVYNYDSMVLRGQRMNVLEYESLALGELAT